MRNKGPIWQETIQRLISEKYASGMVIRDILNLPEIAAIAPSPHTIREVLRANGVRPTWKKKKRKPGSWDRRVVGFIIDRRNEGMTLSRITRAVAVEFPEAAVSRSTVVRILDENVGLIREPVVPARAKDDQIARKIVELYKSGMRVSDIRASALFAEKPPSGHTIREILKRNGVQLTGKKGELRRWPEELQRRIVELYQDGMTFHEIKSDPLIAANRPSDYAIRNILRRFGIVTKRGSIYKEPITAARFRRYRDGLLAEKELSILHRHLAQAPESRAKVADWMGLAQAETLPVNGPEGARVRVLQQAARNWEVFFFWCIDALHRNDVKRLVCVRGVELGKAIAALRRVTREQDEEKIRKSWDRIADIVAEMRRLHEEVLGAPAEASRIPPLPDAV
jgi:signal recognition particle subunit SEC65